MKINRPQNMKHLGPILRILVLIKQIPTMLSEINGDLRNNKMKIKIGECLNRILTINQKINYNKFNNKLIRCNKLNNFPRINK